MASGNARYVRYLLIAIFVRGSAEMEIVVDAWVC